MTIIESKQNYVPDKEYFQLTWFNLYDIFPIRNMKTIHNSRELGAAIRTERKRLKVTQKELAMTAGTGLRFISELERGKKTSRIEGILKVLQTLGLNILIDTPDNKTGERAAT